MLVLKQDVIQTKELSDVLGSHHAHHLLIPECNLSHYLRSASQLFIGAVSVTMDNQAVTGVGTAKVIHAAAKEMFSDENRFSYNSHRQA